jgi:hypothetical protein
MPVKNFQFQNYFSKTYKDKIIIIIVLKLNSMVDPGQSPSY